MSNKKAWGGRFTQSTNELVEQFSESISFDARLYKQDIRGSIAHATMLHSVGILNAEEISAIEAGLLEILEDIDAGRFEWLISREDVHMNIESRLTEKIGEAGKKLHTGRSRNDQVATDIRLYLRDFVDTLVDLISELQTALLNLAEPEVKTIMPGFTHLQVAQPISFAHHMLAWVEMLQRDKERFQDSRNIRAKHLSSMRLHATHLIQFLIVISPSNLLAMLRLWQCTYLVCVKRLFCGCQKPISLSILAMRSAQAQALCRRRRTQILLNLYVVKRRVSMAA